MKYNKFNEIPMFIGTGNYVVNVEIHRLKGYLERLSEDFKVNLTPDFQRERVWTIEQKQQYIEYLLQGGTTGRDLYFNCPFFEEDKNVNNLKKLDLDRLEVVCVDGLQRITAILGFFNNEFKVFGQFAKDFEGKPSNQQSKLNIHINGLLTKKELLEWYIQLNTTGKPHTEEEINKVKEMLLNLK